MNQDPPILIPYVDKDGGGILPTFNTEPILNGYLTNGNKSPPMPVLYEADRDPPPLFNMQDIFSALTKDEYNDGEYSKCEPRNESDSLFEKIYKDYCTTLSTNQLANSKMLTNSTDNITQDALIPDKISPSKSNDITSNTSKKTINNLKDVSKRRRKRKIKRAVEAVSEGEDEEVKKKFGIKTIIKKNKKESKPSELTQNKDVTDNKYLKSPFISLRNGNSKKATSINIISKSYEIVNPALRGASDHHASIYRPNSKAFNTNQFSTSTPCVCALCGHLSSFLQLGSLYGPYFIDRDFVHTLPLTSIFPSEANEIGVSGKSAIKSDKNGNVKMVIQSSRVSRNSTSKKASIVAEDYRVTWDGEVWFHRECILWAPGTYLRGDGKIGGLDEALKMALNAECFVCHKIGAILNCTTKNCDKNFHYYCAASEGCKLNSDQLSVLCSKHKER